MPDTRSTLAALSAPDDGRSSCDDDDDDDGVIYLLWPGSSSGPMILHVATLTSGLVESPGRPRKPPNADGLL